MKQVVMTNRRNQFHRRVALESCRCRPCWFLAARHRNSLSRAGAIASCSIAIIAIARLQHCHGKIAPFGHLPRHCTRGRGCGLWSQLPSCNQSTNNQRKGELVGTRGVFRVWAVFEFWAMLRLARNKMVVEWESFLNGRNAKQRMGIEW